MKKIIIVLLLSISNAFFAQRINDYKYALVPDKFPAIKKKELPRLTMLAKMYMQKYGFESYLSSESMPFDFSNTNCNKLYVDITEENNMFVTKIVVVLKDCNGTILATSPLGKSREKDLNAAYTLALREAFDNFVDLKKYKYNGKVIADNNLNSTVTVAEIAPTEKTINSSSDSQINTPNQLFAQPIANGFQLINSEPKVIMKLFKTSAKDVYTAIKGNLQGVLVTKNNEWFFEYYQNDQIISEKVDVKF